MCTIIREMKREDKREVIDMMQGFYASEAVLSNGSEEIFENDVENCVNESPFLEGYIFEDEGQIQGYAMLAKSFSTEFGKPCIWIEDLFVKETYRAAGIGTKFLTYVREKYADCALRLEAERENENAVHVYEKNGYKELPYLELIRL